MKNLICNKIIIYNILIFFMVFLSLFILLIPGWIYNNFGEMDIERILFTITLPLKGTPDSVLFLFFINLLYPVFLYSCILVIIFNAILYIKYFNATVIKKIYGFIFKLVKTCKVKIIKISIIFSICFLLYIQLINFLLPIKYKYKINFQLITFIILLLIVSFICYIIIYKLKEIKNYYKKIRNYYILILVFFTVVLCLNTVIFFKKYKIYSYISNVLQTSDFYEKHYVDAKKLNIIPPKNKRNLILIFLESMEFSYADKNFFPDNLIPELINLSNNNISFKNFCNGYCQHCTQMAIVANMTGLAVTGFAPNFNLVSGNLKTYLPGSYSIGEILKNNGYTNLFLQGSDKEFSGAGVFLETHGFKNSVFDSSYLKQTYNIINVPWWYVADEDVINIFKKEIFQLKSKTPFFAVMITADTHMQWSGVNPQIPNIPKIFDDEKMNLIRNSSKLINDFISWVNKQDFAKDTTIVLVGDHLRMDDGLFNNYSKQRYIYNCFINSVYENKKINKDKTFWQIDLFPTILEAIGFKIEGNRLGLGTSLFSNKKTLLEEFGEQNLITELAKRNKLYNNLWKSK